MCWIIFHKVLPFLCAKRKLKHNRENISKMWCVSYNSGSNEKYQHSKIRKKERLQKLIFDQFICNNCCLQNKPQIWVASHIEILYEIFYFECSYLKYIDDVLTNRFVPFIITILSINPISKKGIGQWWSYASSRKVIS